MHLLNDVDTPCDGAHNMAVDQALLEAAQQGSITVRFYRWTPACLSFGRNQPARDICSEASARALGIDLVRRPTGGMAVLHDQEITYSVSAPLHMFGGPRAAYAAINRALVAGLQRLEVDAHLAREAKPSRFGTVHPCFAEPAPGEVIAGGRKLVGSAQRCERRALLQHGSILLDGRQETVAHMTSVAFDMANRATNIREILGTVPPMSEIVAALTFGFATMCGTSLAPSTRSQQVTDRAAELIDQYRSAEWTWRH